MQRFANGAGQSCNAVLFLLSRCRRIGWEQLAVYITIVNCPLQTTNPFRAAALNKIKSLAPQIVRAIGSTTAYPFNTTASFSARHRIWVLFRCEKQR
jgi:hypothetical protein